MVSGNPGCAMQITRAGWQILHPAELLARALAPGTPSALTREVATRRS